MRKLACFTVLTALVGSFALVACGDDKGGDDEDADPFDTYQMCWDEHHGTEGFSPQQAITICCLSHPIGSAAKNVVCGDTAATCEAYVGSNLTGSDAGSAAITAGCADYITQRSM